MRQVTTEKLHWTTSDIKLFLQAKNKRYEIINGELFLTRSPHWNHQLTIQYS